MLKKTRDFYLGAKVSFAFFQLVKIAIKDFIFHARKVTLKKLKLYRI